jgi:hypothetical protein
VCGVREWVCVGVGVLVCVRCRCGADIRLLTRWFPVIESHSYLNYFEQSQQAPSLSEAEVLTLGSAEAELAGGILAGAAGELLFWGPYDPPLCGHD